MEYLPEDMPEVACNLQLISRTIKVKGDWFKLIILGDFHIGQEACADERLKRDLRWIATKDPKEYGVVLMGDLIENVIKGSKGSQFEMADPSPDSQMDTAVELLTPIKKYILAMCDGNHEYRTMREAGISLTKTMGQRLGVEQRTYDYRCMLELNLVRGKHPPQTYDVYLHHGVGSSGATTGGRINRLEKPQRNVCADVYAMGHIHHKLASDRVMWSKVNGKMVQRRIQFVSCGSYLTDAEYAVRAGMEPTRPGMARVDLATTRYNIHCST